MRDILKVLANDNFIIVNRDLVDEIGLDETVLLAELCSEQYYWQKNNKLGEDGFFYSTIENVENQIGFKKKKQQLLVNKLKSLNLLEVKYHDLPKKRYVRVNVAQLENIQAKYCTKIITTEARLNESDYNVISKVFFEKEVSKDLKGIFAEYVLMLKQEKNFEINLKNIRGLINSLLKFEDYSVEELKNTINKSKLKKWMDFYPLKNRNIKKTSKKIQKEKNVYQNNNTFDDEEIDTEEIIIEDSVVDSGIIEIKATVLDDDDNE